MYTRNPSLCFCPGPIGGPGTNCSHTDHVRPCKHAAKTLSRRSIICCVVIDNCICMNRNVRVWCLEVNLSICRKRNTGPHFSNQVRADSTKGAQQSCHYLMTAPVGVYKHPKSYLCQATLEHNDEHFTSYSHFLVLLGESQECLPVKIQKSVITPGNLFHKGQPRPTSSGYKVTSLVKY